MRRSTRLGSPSLPGRKERRDPRDHSADRARVHACIHVTTPRVVRVCVRACVMHMQGGRIRSSGAARVSRKGGASLFRSGGRAVSVGSLACLAASLPRCQPGQPATPLPRLTGSPLSAWMRVLPAPHSIYTNILSAQHSLTPRPSFLDVGPLPPPPPLFPSSIALAAPKPAPSPSRVHPRAYPSRQHARILAQDTPHQHRIRHPCCAPVYFRPLARFGRVY